MKGRASTFIHEFEKIAAISAKSSIYLFWETCLSSTHTESKVVCKVAYQFTIAVIAIKVLGWPLTKSASPIQCQ